MQYFDSNKMAEHYTVAPQVVDPVETRSGLTCDTRKLETSISHLGKYAQMPKYVTHSDTCHSHTIATGKEGFFFLSSTGG